MRAGAPLRILLCFGLVLVACGSDPHPAPDRATDAIRSMERPVALDAARRFLDRYVAPGGRVVRHDQGRDTVSEGQAYAMLLAVAVEDWSRFDDIWGWTRDHLQRDDGLLAWRWDDGAITDPMPASDADVDAAHALTLAARTFDESAYARHARRLADAIVGHEVVEGRYGPVLVAGPWAVDERWVNPSYGAPVAFAALSHLTGDEVWGELDDGSRRVVGASTVTSDLPPDWARLTEDAVEAVGPPAGGSPAHGYEAVRTAVRFGIDCDPDGRALAAAMDDEYDDAALAGGGPATVLSLDGEALVDHGHPAASVGAAAAALADGQPQEAARLLAVAETQDRAHPTYYGAAWLALGRVWLSTDELGGCRPDPSEGAGAQS